jgi:xanthine dehydrogenase YagT iron-sulfur-binding subunit
MNAITLTVNGARTQVLVEPRTHLADVLREQLSFTGTHLGCEQGVCGACTVLIDGRRANACLALAVAHDCAEIVSIEGIASGDELHPLQQAFVEHDAFQCGYCTPGQICSALAMLDEHRQGWPSAVTSELTGNPELTDDEIRERMSGNLCRCGAYVNIVPAIAEVAK